MDSKTTAKTVLLVAVPVVCAVLTVIARVHRLELPFERDEGEYAYIAQMMLRGEAPYSEAYTMKLPGVPIWYAAFFLVFGETVRAAHIAALNGSPSLTPTPTYRSSLALPTWCSPRCCVSTD